jgi:hypothetical protein
MTQNTIKNKIPPTGIERIFLVLGMLFLFGCEETQTMDESDSHSIQIENPNKPIPRVESFDSYLANFNTLELPITIKSCLNNTFGLKEFDGIAFNKYTERLTFAYGKISTPTNHIVLITLDATDCQMPILSTYEPSGKLIDQKHLGIGLCGAGCGYSCDEFMIFNKNYTFYSSDTISSYSCDSLGDETPGTYEHYVIYKKGKLLPNGKITLSEEMKESLL